MTDKASTNPLTLILSGIIAASAFGFVFAAFGTVLTDNIGWLAGWGYWDFFAAYVAVSLSPIAVVLRTTLGRHDK